MLTKIMYDPTPQEYVDTIRVYAPQFMVVMAFITDDNPGEVMGAYRDAWMKMNWIEMSFSFQPIWIGFLDEDQHREAIISAVHDYQNMMRSELAY